MWSQLRNAQSAAMRTGARRVVVNATPANNILASAASSSSSSSSSTTPLSSSLASSSASSTTSTSASYTSLSSVNQSSSSLQHQSSSFPSTPSTSHLTQAREVIERGLSTLSFSTYQPNNNNNNSNKNNNNNSNIDERSDIAGAFALGPDADAADADAATSFVAPVSPHADFPTRVYSKELGFISHPRTHGALAATLGSFWGAVVYAHFAAPQLDVPLWWGGLGIATSAFTVSITNFKSKRTIVAIDMSKDGHRARLTSLNILGQEVHTDVSIAHIGPNPPVATGEYWSIKLPNTKGYYILNTSGDIHDLDAVTRVLGYDPTTHANHKLSPLAVQQLQQQQQQQQATINSAINSTYHSSKSKASPFTSNGRRSYSTSSVRQADAQAEASTPVTSTLEPIVPSGAAVYSFRGYRAGLPRRSARNAWRRTVILREKSRNFSKLLDESIPIDTSLHEQSREVNIRRTTYNEASDPALFDAAMQKVRSLVGGSDYLPLPTTQLDPATHVMVETTKSVDLPEIRTPRAFDPLPAPTRVYNPTRYIVRPEVYRRVLRNMGRVVLEKQGPVNAADKSPTRFRWPYRSRTSWRSLRSTRIMKSNNANFKLPASEWPWNNQRVEGDNSLSKVSLIRPPRVVPNSALHQRLKSLGLDQLSYARTYSIQSRRAIRGKSTDKNVATLNMLNPSRWMISRRNLWKSVKSRASGKAYFIRQVVTPIYKEEQAKKEEKWNLDILQGKRKRLPFRPPSHFTLNADEYQKIPWLEPYLFSRSLYSRQYGQYNLVKLPTAMKRYKWITSWRQYFVTPASLRRRYLKHRMMHKMRRVSTQMTLNQLMIKTNRRFMFMMWRNAQRYKRGYTNFQSLLQTVEGRLDVMIYRMDLAPTLRWARELVRMGIVRVNQEIVRRPQHALKPGDVISYDYVAHQQVKSHFRSEQFGKTITENIIPRNKVGAAVFLGPPHENQLRPTDRLNPKYLQWLKLDLCR